MLMKRLPSRNSTISTINITRLKYDSLLNLPAEREGLMILALLFFMIRVSPCDDMHDILYVDTLPISQSPP